MMRQTSIVRPGEEIVFEGWNSTFHRSRSVDYVIAVSNRALYLPVRSRVPWRRPSSTRIPLDDILSIELREHASDSRLAVGIAWCIPMVPIVVGLLLSMRSARPWRVLSMNAALQTALLATVVFHTIRARRGRTEVVVRCKRAGARFVTPPDTYADDRAFDRKVLRDALRACRSQGVNDCADRTPA